MSLELTLLVKAASEGDREAFGQLTRRTRPLVRMILRERVGTEAAEDLVQETYLEAWVRIAGLRDPRTFVGWLKSIARTRASAWERRRAVEDAALPRLAVEEAYEFSFDDGGWSDSTFNALNDLDPETRELVTLRHAKQWSTAEVAKKLNLTPTVVKKRLSRALFQLRRRLKPQEDRHDS